MLDIVTAVYRAPDGTDTPLDIYTAADWASINNKFEVGDPSLVFLEPNKLLASKILYVWPARQSVNTQTVITGTDALAYRCVRSHTAAADNRPITGANYLLYWELGGSGPAAWASGSSYVAPQQIRFTYKRPLFDFDLATDNPDFPSACDMYLVYRLAAVLSDDYGLAIEERQRLEGKAKAEYDTVYTGVQVPKATSQYNRARYY
jgi:hypothetical protein